MRTKRRPMHDLQNVCPHGRMRGLALCSETSASFGRYALSMMQAEQDELATTASVAVESRLTALTRSPTERLIDTPVRMPELTLQYGQTTTNELAIELWQLRQTV